MAVLRRSLRYGAAAVLIAFTIIGVSLYSNTTWSIVNGQTSFVIMLTDPPNVPKGTTVLEVIYSNIQLHNIASDGTANWVAAQESGKVDLLSLVNITQTIASLNLPTGSTVDKLQFTISSARATINGVGYPVTILTDQLILSLRGTKLNGTTTGALIDLRPTLVRIKASDSNGEKASYYVLVPSATAIVRPNVNEDQKQTGAKSHLDDDENEDLNEEYERARHHIAITDATLSVSGDETNLTVTLENTGSETARFNGLKVQGDFKTNPDVTIKIDEGDDDDDHDGILFKISGNKLIPLPEKEDEESDNSTREMKPGESLTLSFRGVTKLTPHEDSEGTEITITPVKGSVYTIRLLGQASEPYQATAS